MTNGKSELIGFARGLAIECKLAHPPARSTDVSLLESRVRDGEPSVIENIMAHELVDECFNFAAKFCGFRIELCHGLSQSVAELHIASAQLA